MLKNKYFIIIALILLLFIIPATSASDNNTDLHEIDNHYLKINNTEEILSVDSPHKELTDEDLKNDSIIYLKNGEYDYKQKYKHRNITFIGEDTSKTIINGNGSTINITEFLSFNNITLKNIKINAPKNLTATNAIFKDFKSTYSKDFERGMIYNDYNGISNITLMNCTFYNNSILDAGILEVYYSTLNIKDSKIVDNENIKTDEYIRYGIIYASKSILNISNCEFINNKIGSSSGVLTCEKSPINISDSKFVNNTAKSTACIYEINSDTSIIDCEFINNTATANYGSVYIHGGNLYISKCEFINNTAEKRGGSICYTTYSNSNFTIDNCTFYDSKAKLTGGSIYVSRGNINIKDCKFYNSQANNGGAILFEDIIGDQLLINITSTEFINCSSKSKGGAIYCSALYCSFRGTNLSIVNTKSRYGGGIFAKDCDSIFDNLTITNSSSHSGAYFHQNGNLKLINSNFSSNTGDFGSSIYLTDMQDVLIENNTFKNNNAIGYGSAIYFISNSTQEFSKNNYENNSAKNNETVYVYCISYDNDNLIIISRNYTFFIGNYSDTDYIPPYYNLVDLNQVTSVKNQEEEGNCWAFAAIGGLEANVLKANNLYLDFSENNMKNIESNTSPFGWIYNPNYGGNTNMHIGYLVSWLGPVLEENDPYMDISTESNLFDSILHVQNILDIKRNNFTDNDEIKKAIMKYGGIVSPIFSTKAVKQYYNESIYSNHEIVIVGWNDTMEIPDAPGLGTWICKNSWGNDWGEDGYFYVSYYDTSCPSTSNFLETSIIIFNSTIKYEKNYQYDQAQTSFINTKSDSVWYKNRFNATNNELLAGVSTYFEEDSFWNLSVYVNDTLKLITSGFSKSGYWTIELGDFIPLEIGDVFEIAFQINRQNASVPICEATEFVNRFYNKNTSFISFDGEKWSDLYDYKLPDIEETSMQVACIKAFTVLINESFIMLSHQIEIHDNYLELSSDYAYNSIDEKFANGIIISKDNFTIDGKGHTINGAGLARIFNITANNVTLKNINFINGNSDISGGAVYFHGTGSVINSTFANNTATPYGGALFFEKTGNITFSSFSQNSANKGGAIYADEGIWIMTSEFENNTATSYGGAINFQNGILEIIDSQFNNNQVNINNFGYGGAIYTENSTNTINKSSFKGNTAFKGGAIKIRNDTDATITDCEFISNKAYTIGEGHDWNESASGGAIYASINLNLKISNSQFIENTIDSPNAFGLGGAIYVNGNLTVDNSTFDKNIAISENDISIASAIASGGNNTQILINNTKIKNGQSQRAAVYIWRSNATIDNTTFTNNNASENGGALHYYNGYAESTTLTLINSVFSENNANNGGAVYIRNSTANVINTSFRKNNARSGGSLYTEGGELNITNSQFIENRAYAGGAIDNYEGEINIENTQFTNNNASVGGAIQNKANMTINDSEFIGNGENCINVIPGAKITLNNISSDVQLVNDTINITIFEAEDVTYGNDVNIIFHVNSSAISQLSSGKIVVSLNNVEYNADVKDGIATLIIPNLNAGTYNTNVTYIDNNLTRAEIAVNFTVNKKDITINAKNAEFNINYDGTYTVDFINLTDGVNVTFILNNKNIETTTIKNGFASIILTANILKTAKSGKKNMIIKIENNNYNPITKTVEITINKEKTKITAKSKTFKRTIKTKKYSIMLKNSKGKAIPKAKVTLKVKGKKYKVKTNKKGKATFKITKLTKKGTHKATITYKGNNYYNKVNKKIKIKIK